MSPRNSKAHIALNECGSPAILCPNKPPHSDSVYLKIEGTSSLALAARGLYLRCLCCLLHLREHLANGFVGPRATLFSPGLQPLGLFFEVGEEVRAAEHGAPRADHRLHLFPNDPLFPVAFEEEVFVDQPAVYNARHHLPITKHHAYVRVFLAAGRTQARQVLCCFRVEVGREPIPRFSQLWLAPVLKQPQHQIHLLVRYFAHVSSFGFGFWTDFFVPLFALSIFAMSAVNPPPDS